MVQHFNRFIVGWEGEKEYHFARKFPDFASLVVLIRVV
jgi:hypothetical protein